jgi:hypothetical protein
LLENAIRKTTRRNLRDHDEGGRLVLIASVCLIRYHPGKSGHLKSQAEKLLGKSYRVLRVYSRRTGDKIAKDYARFQKERIADLEKYACKREPERVCA